MSDYITATAMLNSLTQDFLSDFLHGAPLQGRNDLETLAHRLGDLYIDDHNGVLFHTDRG